MDIEMAATPKQATDDRLLDAALAASAIAAGIPVLSPFESATASRSGPGDDDDDDDDQSGGGGDVGNIDPDDDEGYDDEEDDDDEDPLQVRSRV
jgi:hypothetical protein